jgi:hypothetical protein
MKNVVAALAAGLSAYGETPAMKRDDYLPVDKWQKSQNRMSQKKRRARARWKR